MMSADPNIPSFIAGPIPARPLIEESQGITLVFSKDGPVLRPYPFPGFGQSFLFEKPEFGPGHGAESLKQQGYPFVPTLVNDQRNLLEFRQLHPEKEIFPGPPDRPALEVLHDPYDPDLRVFLHGLFQLWIKMVAVVRFGQFPPDPESEDIP